MIHDPFLCRAASVTGVARAVICASGRAADNRISKVRFAVAHVMREQLHWSYPRIAGRLGFRNHSSALYAVRQSRRLRTNCSDHARMLSELERVI